MFAVVDALIRTATIGWSDVQSKVVGPYVDVLCIVIVMRGFAALSTRVWPLTIPVVGLPSYLNASYQSSLAGISTAFEPHVGFFAPPTGGNGPVCVAPADDINDEASPPPTTSTEVVINTAHRRAFRRTRLPHP
jgi:hypothetical protein